MPSNSLGSATGAPSGLFPVINDGIIQPESAEDAVTIDPVVLEEMLLFCRRAKVPVSHFLATIWAVILRQYTVQDQIQMQLKTGKDMREQGTILSTSVEPRQGISDFFWREAWHIAQGGSTTSPPPNTMIVFPEQGLSGVDPHCDIMLAFSTDEEPTLTVQFKLATLSAGHARLLGDLLAHYIRSAVYQPEQSVRDISRVDLSPHGDVIRQWNTRPGPRSPGIAIHSLIRLQALRNGHRPAIHAWDKALSYWELDCLSTRLAIRLHALDIGPRCLVAVCFEKSAWAIVSMLAINKTGAAFVPLDPSQPRQRLETILQQVPVAALVTSAQHADIVPGSPLVRMVIPGEMMESLPVDERNTILPRPTADDPAYCLFTSGSTGTPRGCLVQHAALSSVANHSQALRIDAGSRVLQFASFAFGISLIEIWCTLTAGGVVCMPSGADRNDHLVDVINEMKIDWALMTPTTIQLLRPEQVPGLRIVGVAGEPLRRAQIQLWADAVHLFQAFGLTEWAGICAVSRQVGTSTSSAVIGASAGGRFWLVDPDDHHQLAPIGAEAELVIEGPSLAQEYMNHPEQTAAKFIAPPTWWMGSNPAASTRLYKTGDLVRYNTDGSLCYVSRKGLQTKVRGQRVELGEVEYHLKQAAAEEIKTVVDIVQLSGEEDATLAAFLLAERPPGERPQGHLEGAQNCFVAATADLRTAILQARATLQDTVPSYMVPGLFIPISYLPVTVSGKTDRRRLREMAQQCSRGKLTALTRDDEPIQEPQTETERLLQEWTAEVLNLPSPEVGMNQHFLEMGGDSVSAMKLVGLARQRGVALTVADVFQHPSLGALAQRLTSSETPQAGPKEFELLPESSKRESLLTEIAALCSVTTDEIDDVYPCTAMQQGLMALSANQAGACLARFQYAIQPGVDVARLQAAWMQVVEANAIFRTRIVQTGAHGMLQVVLRPHTFRWDEAGPSLSKYLKKVDERRMHLADALIAAAVIDSMFVLTVHHALCDRWSMQTAMRQLEHCYTHGSSPALPAFACFVSHVHQQHLRQHQHQEYWRDYFRDLDVEIFPAIPATHTPVADSKIEALVRLPTGVLPRWTMATLLQAAWAIVVAHHTSSADVVFGATVSGRGAALPDVDRICGPTIANVPVRIGLDREEPLARLLDRVQQQMVAMIPFEQDGVQNIRGYSDEAAIACRYQSLLVVQPRWETPAPHLWSDSHQDATAVGAFAATALSLVCSLTDCPREIRIEAIFDAHVLPPTRVQRLLHHYESILHTAVQDLSQTMGTLASITPEELGEIQDWHRRLPPPTTTTACAHQLIDQQVRQRPEAPAVSSWDGDLTYAELDRLSTTLARRLALWGVASEQFIPVCLEKGKWSAVAVLAVIKTGAAFTLLDPSHPVDRLRTICHTLGASVVISSGTQWAGTLETEVELVDPEEVEGAERSELFELPESHPDQALYAVFTSGSTTGQPKGVVIEHRAFCSSALAHNPLHGVGPTSRVLQFASYAFDISILEILSTLIAGGCVCVPSEEQRRDAVVETANRLRVTHAFLTPSILRGLDPMQLEYLETLILGGEALLPSDLSRLMGQRFRVLNEYGPAECAVTATVTQALQEGDDPRNIGFPVGSRCWIVDRRDHHRLVPISAVGELVIEGPTVGRGYLADANADQTSYVEPPAWLQQQVLPGKRVYKTGDLVQYHLDGSLQFVGRKDRQIKIRGQRIEPEEVETQLRRCFPGLHDGVVEMAIFGEAQTAALVAFVQQEHFRAREGANLFVPPSEEFQRDIGIAEGLLRQRLPGFMVPAVFLPVSSIPQTGTGKVDRRRLRAAVERLTDAELQAYRVPGCDIKRAPESEQQRVLQAIWAMVLHRETDSIGLDDHFFYLGGHSIHAMEVSSQARAMHWDLTVSEIFAHPVLEHQACLLRPSAGADDSVPVPFSLIGEDMVREDLVQTAAEQCRIHPDEVQDMYPCSPFQEGLLALSARHSASSCVGQWVYRLPLEVDIERLREAWECVAQRHAILRTRMVQGPDRRLYQAVVGSVSLWWQVCPRLSATSMEEIRREMMMGLGRPLVHLLLHEQTAPRLLLTMHHASYDEVSMRHILHDVEAAYRGFHGLVTRPFAPFIQFYLQRAADPADEQYWRQALTDLAATPFPDLPTASYQPSSSKVLEHRMSLRAHHEYHRAGVTRASQIHLAWAIVQSRYQRNPDVVFGVTVSGRSAPVPGMERISGPTIATVPLRLVLDPQQPLGALAHRVQDIRSATIAHEHAGLQSIRQWGSDAAQACSFQTLLIVQPGRQYDPHGSEGLLQLVDSVTDWTAFSSYALLLAFELHEGEGEDEERVVLQVCFDPAVIPEPQVHRVVATFTEVLQHLILHPETRLQDLSSISHRDYQEIVAWNSRQESIATSYHSVHQRIHEQCLRHPDFPAVCAWDGDFSSQELNVLSTRLAEHLSQQGVRPEEVVPLYFEKSRWTTVAILAVLKAGAVFVLLDPSHPLERLRDMCEQVHGRVLLVSERCIDMPTSLCAVQIPVGDHYRDSWPCVPQGWTGPPTSPNQALYIVFTSGSTGRPKGVVIEHGGFCCAAQAHAQALGLDQTSRMLQFSAYAFDMSAMETLTTLLMGGCLCVLSEMQRRESDRFVEAVQSLRASHAILTPSFARSIPVDRSLGSLKVLGLVGEKVKQGDVDKWASTLHLANTYGPAECSALSVIQPQLGHQHPSTIGFGTGCTTWVVDPDDYHRLVPIGATGELLIEGPIVGRGYINQPEKTAEVFIGPPAWRRELPLPWGRLYRTGDLVRYDASGALVFQGRNDTQVKVRGQRLELGEVESRVQSYFPGASDAVAELVDLHGGDLLVVFVLPEKKTASAPDPASSSPLAPYSAEFRADAIQAECLLREVLPDYMVPALFLPLWRMPHTASGKADRRCLRKATADLSPEEVQLYREEPAQQQQGEEEQQMLSEEERSMREVWAAVLRLPQSRIRADSHFFRLGGDSIVAMKVAPMARERGLGITVADVFETPRLRELTMVGMQNAPWQKGGQKPVPLALSPLEDPFEYFQCLQALGLVPAQSELEDLFAAADVQSFFLKRRTTHHYTFTLTGRVDVDRLQQACQWALESFSVLRTFFARHGDQHLQVVLRQLELPFHHITGLADLPAFQKSLWDADRLNEVLPALPARFMLLSSRDAQEHVFIVRLLHAQWDAISIPVLFNAIATNYNVTAPPSPPSTDFSDFLHCRSQQPKSPALEFWRSLLEGSRMTSLPTGVDRSSDLPTTTLWENQEIQTPHQPPTGITMATLVKTAWAYVLWTTTGERDLTFGQTVNGRSLPLPGADSILGPCISIIPVRIRLDPASWSVQDLLQMVQDQHTQSLRHDFVDLSDIVDHSTAWPKGTEFASIVQHQNFDFDYRLPLQGLQSRFSLQHNFSPRSELFIFTYPLPDRLLVQVCVSTAVMERSRAVELLNQLCGTIKAFAHSPEKRLCDIGEVSV
ncbi:hypothetical protein EYZ11_004127 [Aspergillus tanneri]|uniref:Carrier domain-containing protein n=1 Tax=Aspergillus tanneri TaxID=1220188 RepID=A0A4S3JLN8_9EURO|nr:hypothetical protein EYZ11_004127 [Aspergillus tanneri]